MSALSVSIPRYEDSFDEDHSSVTHYIVVVTNTKTNHSYELKKRYSDFAKLYNAIKDKYKDVETFKFPNKSMFHTQASTTKDRRMERFAQLMKILVSIAPVPEFSEFLEINKFFFQENGGNNGNKQASRLTNSSGNNNNSKQGGKDISSTTTPKKSQKYTDPVTPNTPKTPSSSSATTATGNKTVSTTATFFSKTLPTSFAIVLTLYIFFIYMKLIDISHSTTERIFLTIFILTVCLAVTRVVFTSLFS